MQEHIQQKQFLAKHRLGLWDFRMKPRTQSVRADGDKMFQQKATN